MAPIEISSLAIWDTKDTADADQLDSPDKILPEKDLRYGLSGGTIYCRYQSLP